MLGLSVLKLGKNSAITLQCKYSALYCIALQCLFVHCSRGGQCREELECLAVKAKTKNSEECKCNLQCMQKKVECKMSAIECQCKAVSVHLKTRIYNAVNIIGCQCKAVSGVVLSCLGIN